MIRALLFALVLTGCAQTSSNGFTTGVSDIAAQRMRFAAEAVCLNNVTRGTQVKAARGLNFPVRAPDAESVVYADPGTLTFIRIGPVPDQTFTDDQGRRRTIEGDGCSVGSPAVDTRRANRLAGEILTPRLIDGSETLLAPLGAGKNADGGVGFFFDNLAVTLPVASTTFANPDTGEAVAFDHPVILIVHARAG